MTRSSCPRHQHRIFFHTVFVCSLLLTTKARRLSHPRNLNRTLVENSSTENSSLQWIQQANDILAGTTNWRESDFHVAMSGDGSTVSIGVPMANDGKGQVSIAQFDLVTEQWLPLGPILMGDLEQGHCGYSVALDETGSKLIVGCPGTIELSSWWRRVDASMARVYQFNPSENIWEQLGDDLMRFEVEEGAASGWSVAMDLKGTSVAVSAPMAVNRQGQVQTYRLDEGTNTWTVFGQTIENTVNDAEFGFSVALSGDSSTLAIGSRMFDQGKGQVQSFRLDDNADRWEAHGFAIVGDSESGLAGGQTGATVDLSTDGSILAIGSGEYTAPNNNRFGGGLVRIYEFANTDLDWAQLGQDILPDFDCCYGWGSFGDGRSLSLSGDGQTVVVGAPGVTVNNVVLGLVRVFRLQENEWIQVGQTLEGEQRYSDSTPSGDWFVSTNLDGSRLVVGAPLHTSCDDPDQVLNPECRPNPSKNENWIGHVRVYDLKQVEITEAPSNMPSPFPNTRNPTPAPTPLSTMGSRAPTATTVSLEPTDSPTPLMSLLHQSESPTTNPTIFGTESNDDDDAGATFFGRPMTLMWTVSSIALILCI